MTTGRDADARLDIGGRGVGFSADEMMDAVEPGETDQDQIDGDDVIEQTRNDQDQDAGNERGERGNMSGGELHRGLRVNGRTGNGCARGWFRLPQGCRDAIAGNHGTVTS